MGDIPGRPPDPTQNINLERLLTKNSGTSCIPASTLQPVQLPCYSTASLVPAIASNCSSSAVSFLDPYAPQFMPRFTNPCGDLHADIGGGEEIDILPVAGVEQVLHEKDAAARWFSGTVPEISRDKTKQPKNAKEFDDSLLPVLPFMDDLELSALPTPAKPVVKSTSLLSKEVVIPGTIFVDRVLPAPSSALVPHPKFSPSYFVDMGNAVAAAGYDQAGFCYPAGTPNFLGARIPLLHTSLRIDRWRQLLIGYEDAHIVQNLEFGFPLGLREFPEIESCTRNHGSSYSFYPYIDKFVAGELQNAGLTGPFGEAPWVDLTCAPLMTAPKKPDGRRAVFDATYGEKSLNNATPTDMYLGQPCVYTFPKINDYRMMILKSGRDSYLWKRDLHRYYLQLPLCPSEYHRVAFVWRGLIFFFIALMFGLRHSGLQGQKVTDAVSWIHRKSGLNTPEEREFNVCNYSDDLGGVESTAVRAEASYLGIAALFIDLGLSESSSKASSPSRQMVYLGVNFDTNKMEMSVPVEKLSELKAEIDKWARKTVITKKELQGLLGRLFWVAKVVRFSRIFMGRLLTQLRDLSGKRDHEKVRLEDQSRKDLLWWSKFLRTFNGVSMIVNEDAIPLSLEQLLDTPEKVCAGDSTPTGIGAWHSWEYWSQLVPQHLLGLPIHILEFWAVIVSCKLWGEKWTGQVIQIFTDNDSVADVITYEKPRDPEMLSLLREFIYIVCEKKFIPVLRKISSEDNILADHISRRFDEDAALESFSRHGLNNMKLITAPDTFFRKKAPW